MKLSPAPIIHRLPVAFFLGRNANEEIKEIKPVKQLQKGKNEGGDMSLLFDMQDFYKPVCCHAAIKSTIVICCLLFSIFYIYGAVSDDFQRAVQND